MAAWKYEISLLVLSSRVSSFRISVRGQYPTVAHRFQNTSQNLKHVPESKNTSQNPNTLSRIQNTSQNPDYFPESNNTSFLTRGDARAYHELLQGL